MIWYLYDITDWLDYPNLYWKLIKDFTRMKRLQNTQGLHYIDAQNRKSQAYQPNNLKNMSHNSSIGYDQNPNGAN